MINPFKGLFGIFGEKAKHPSAYMPPILGFEQKWEARMQFRYVYLEEKDWEKIEKEVEEHKVSKAIKDIAKWIKDLKRAEQYVEKEGVNQVFMYFHIIKSTTHFTNVLEKFLEHIVTLPATNDVRRRFMAIGQRILPKLILEIEEIEKWGQQDMKFLMADMNEALDKGPAQLIAQMRTAFRERHLKSNWDKIFQRLGLKKDIKEEYRDRKLLESTTYQLHRIDTKLKPGAKENVYREALPEFESVLMTSEKAIVGMFRAAHLVLKRDALLMTIIISDENLMKALGPKWVQAHFMPEIPITNTTLSVKELEKQLSERAHTIANGLNVIMKKVKEFEPKFKEALARTARG